MAPPAKRARMKVVTPEEDSESESGEDFGSASGSEYAPSPKKRRSSGTPRASTSKRAARGSPAGGAAEGLGGVRLHMRCKTLEEENAELREQLAAVQAPTRRLKYERSKHADFLKQIHKAPSIELLDLSELVRHTVSFTGNWYPKWKPDAKLEAALATLLAAADEVYGVDLGDAVWAQEEKYAKEFGALLRKYKKNVTNVRVTIRALVERPETDKSVKKTNWRYAKYGTPRTYSKVDVMNLVGSMPKLTKLELVFNGLSCSEKFQNGYGGAFQNKKLFAKVKDLRVFLTAEWLRDHYYGDVDKDVKLEAPEKDSNESSAYLANQLKWRREKPADSRLSDLLRCRRDVITHLDMKAFKKTTTEHPILEQVAALTSLRSIALRVELLHLTGGMKNLETLDLKVHGRLRPEVMDSVVSFLSGSPAALRNLRRLEVRVEPVSFDPQLSVLLAALAGRCCRLEAVSLTGSSWRSEDVAALLAGDKPLAELELHCCAALEAEHLPLVAALPRLRLARLPSRLRAHPGADLIAERKGLDLRWQ